jgi:hypothetical protein
VDVAYSTVAYGRWISPGSEYFAGGGGIIDKELAFLLKLHDSTVCLLPPFKQSNLRPIGSKLTENSVGCVHDLTQQLGAVLEMAGYMPDVVPFVSNLPSVFRDRNVPEFYNSDFRLRFMTDGCCTDPNTSTCLLKVSSEFTWENWFGKWPEFKSFCSYAEKSSTDKGHAGVSEMLSWITTPGHVVHVKQEASPTATISIVLLSGWDIDDYHGASKELLPGYRRAIIDLVARLKADGPTMVCGPRVHGDVSSPKAARQGAHQAAPGSRGPGPLLTRPLPTLGMAVEGQHGLQHRAILDGAEVYRPLPLNVVLVH